jgi:hypothetical protein
MSTVALLEPVIGKRQWWFRITRSFNAIDPPGWRVFDAGIIRLKEIPEAGKPILRKHYSGIWIRFRFWFPIDRA